MEKFREFDKQAAIIMRKKKMKGGGWKNFFSFS